MKAVTCPICGAAMPGNWTEYPDFPFCTKRCRTIDLGRWLDEGYRVAGPGDERDRSTAGEPGSDAG